MTTCTRGVALLWSDSLHKSYITLVYLFVINAYCICLVFSIPFSSHLSVDLTIPLLTSRQNASPASLA